MQKIIEDVRPVLSVALASEDNIDNEHPPSGHHVLLSSYKEESDND